MSKRILLVEDEKLMLKFLEFHLTKDGYNVQIAKDGREAEECINKESFSLIITDLLMPFVSGFELLEKIKVTDHNKDTPILITAPTAITFTFSSIKGFTILISVSRCRIQSTSVHKKSW